MTYYFGYEKPSIEDIEHFGVKGMKWGVRKDRKKGLTDEELTKARDNTLAVFGKLASARETNKPMTESEYSKLSTNDEVINTKTVTRIAGTKRERFSDKTYVSYKPGDVDHYRAMIPTQGTSGGKRKYDKTYEAVYNVVGQLKSPSEKARVDALNTILETKSISFWDGSQVRRISGREYLSYSEHYKPLVDSIRKQELGRKVYRDVVTQIGARNALNNAYLDELRRRGYTALVDENNKGILTEAPLIILNPNGTIKRASVKRLSDEEINRAQLRLRV